MDAESRRRRRESSISLREQRWSMSSQRLEQIVAALMKPVSHYGQSFDRDDSGLLEEYLTAAGLRALEALEAGHEPPPPNYAEMGLVIQSFANNYSKKVDHLSRLVNSFKHTLYADLELAPDAEPTSPGPEAPQQRSGGGGDTAAGAAFAPVQLASHCAARRGAGPAGPPPTLPRVFAELQPRAPAAERALYDYDGEPIGALDDFRVAWRLHDGYLLEELAAGAGDGAELPPLSLMELQEACARAASPAPPPLAPHTPPPPSPSPSPCPSPSPPAACSTPLVPPPAALRRKRRGEIRVEDLLTGSFNLDITASVRKRLAQWQEFSVSESWVRRVVRHRRDVILSARLAAAADPPPTEFRGFDMGWLDIGGFRGWGRGECAEAHAQARRAGAARADLELGDDGFYERSSSLGDCSLDHFHQVSSGADSGVACAATATHGTGTGTGTGATLDLVALARHVRRALPPPPHALAWPDLAAATAADQPQLGRVLFDVLMKATRGEVEIEQGEPLSIGDFSVRALAPDEEELSSGPRSPEEP